MSFVSATGARFTDERPTLFYPRTTVCRLRLFERGVFDNMEVASITGHKTLAMLKRYTHLKAEDLAKKMG